MATPRFPPLSVTPCPCRFAKAAPVHHDQLVLAGSRLAMALELFELAAAWDELDWTDEAVIPPGDWLEFAAVHDWPERELAERLFGVAVDVALRKAANARAYLVR